MTDKLGTSLADGPPATLLSHSHELWWREDAQGCLCEVSASVLPLCGWPAEALLGQPVSRLLEAGDDGGRALLLARERPPRWVALHTSPLVDALGRPDGRWVLARDLTEQLRLEARLQHSERRYLELGETASEGVAVVQDWCFKFVNRHLCEFVGFPEEELLGRPFLDFILEDDHELLKSNHRKRLQGVPMPMHY